MQRLLFFFAVTWFMLSPAQLSAQCITTSAPQFTVLSGQTAVITPGHPNIIHVCGNAVAYDTLGNSVGREYHLDPGSALYIRLDSATTVFMKSTALLDHYNDPSTIAINYEVSSTIANVISSLLNLCPLITFPQAICTMGVDEFSMQRGLHLYPNPTVNELHLFYNGNAGEMKAEITDLLGRVVDELTLEANKPATYSTAKLQEAVYFVTLKKDGRIVEKKKLMVVR